MVSVAAENIGRAVFSTPWTRPREMRVGIKSVCVVLLNNGVVSVDSLSPFRGQSTRESFRQVPCTQFVPETGYNKRCEVTTGQGAATRTATLWDRSRVRRYRSSMQGGWEGTGRGAVTVCRCTQVVCALGDNKVPKVEWEGM